MVISGDGSKLTKQAVSINGKFALPALAVHTLSVGSQIATTELTGLVVEQTQTSAIPAILASNLNTNMLLFRGEQTPQWNIAEAADRISRWFDIVYQWSVQVTQGNKEMNWDEVYNKTQRAFLRDIFKAYDFKYFEGPANSALLKRQPL